MENKKFTKRAVLTSIIAVILCCALLVGGTFAWFTDTATTGINTIESGNLDIELYYATQADVENNEIPDGAWKTVDANTPVFNQEALWEPGYTEVVYFKVANLGNLSLKYRMGVEIFNEKSSTNKLGAEFNLSDYIKAYRTDADEVSIIETRANAQKPWGDFLDLGVILSEAVEGEFNGLEASAGGSLNVSAWLAPEEVGYTTLVMWMPEEVGNEANYLEREDVEAPQIQLGVNVTATQYSWEEEEVDSFNHTYDENAQYVNVDVDNTPDDANNIVTNPGEHNNIDLNNETLTSGIYNNGGEVVLENGTLSVEQAGVQNYGGNVAVTNVNMNAGSPTDYGIISVSDSYTVLNDVELVSGGGGIGVDAGAEVVINGGSVAVNSKSTSGRYNIYAVGEGSVVTINGGEYSFSSTLNQKRAYIYVGTGATVYVNGGTFGPASTRSGYTAGILGEGTVIITGGTFGFDPSTWVAEGYEAVQEGTTWTVSKTAE